MDENVEALAQATALEGRYTGRAGIRQWWDDLLGAFPDWTIEGLDVREVGDLTLMAFEASGHAAGSGMPMTFRGWQVARWTDRRCVRWETFKTEQEALEAAGLPE